MPWQPAGTSSWEQYLVAFNETYMSGIWPREKDLPQFKYVLCVLGQGICSCPYVQALCCAVTLNQLHKCHNIDAFSVMQCKHQCCLAYRYQRASLLHTTNMVEERVLDCYDIWQALRL